MKNSIFKRQQLFAVHVGSQEVRWILARDEAEALDTALAVTEKQGKVLGKYPAALAAKPKEFRAAAEIVKRKIERKEDDGKLH